MVVNFSYILLTLPYAFGQRQLQGVGTCVSRQHADLNTAEWIVIGFADAEVVTRRNEIPRSAPC